MAVIFGARVRRWLSLAALLVPQTCAVRATAQAPRWDVWRTSVDQFGPWEVRGPRVGLQALGAAGTAETYRALRALRVPARVAMPTAAAGLCLAPHVVGLARGRYRLDAADWAADCAIRGGAVTVAHAIERKHGRARALALYAATWAVAAGWAHP